MNYVFEDCEYSRPLIQRVKDLNLYANAYNYDVVDLEIVKKAVAFAKYWHGDQMRKSGDPYYSHPVAVAILAIEQEFSMNIIVGALLHDVLEDSNCTFDIISHEFTPRIAQIVYRLTRIRDGKKISVKQIVQEAFLANDIEVMIIKWFDRIHNIETIKYMPIHKQNEIKLETIDTIIMIAFYLGNIDVEQIILKLVSPEIFQKSWTQKLSSTFDNYDPLGSCVSSFKK